MKKALSLLCAIICIPLISTASTNPAEIIQMPPKNIIESRLERSKFACLNLVDIAATLSNEKISRAKAIREINLKIAVYSEWAYQKKISLHALEFLNCKEETILEIIRTPLNDEKPARTAPKDTSWNAPDNVKARASFAKRFF